MVYAPDEPGSVAQRRAEDKTNGSRLMTADEIAVLSTTLENILAPVLFADWCDMVDASVNDPLVAVLVNATAIMKRHLRPTEIASHVLGGPLVPPAARTQEQTNLMKQPKPEGAPLGQRRYRESHRARTRIRAIRPLRIVPPSDN